jgi:hypothetical protein
MNLAKLFAKNADELLHDFSKDGSIDKTLAHGLVAEIASQIAGNKAGSGFLAGAANEALINKIDQLANGNPAAQWISAALGATVNAATGGNVNTGAMVAQTGTQWNKYEKIPAVQQEIIDHIDSGAYLKLPDDSYHLSYDPKSNVGVAVDNEGRMTDFVWNGGEKFTIISKNLIGENMSNVKFKRTDSTETLGATGIYSFEEYDGMATGNRDFSNIAKNTVKETGNVPFSLANYYGSTWGFVAKFVDAKLKALDWGTTTIKNWKEYSGLEFWKAESIDIGGPFIIKGAISGASGLSQYARTRSVVHGVLVGAAAGVAVDTGIDQYLSEIKKKYLETDQEKKDKKNKGILIKQGTKSERNATTSGEAQK